MIVGLKLLKNLLSKRVYEIVAGIGYLAKTVSAVATFLPDKEMNYELLTSKQKAVFAKVLKPLLEPSL